MRNALNILTAVNAIAPGNMKKSRANPFVLRTDVSSSHHNPTYGIPTSEWPIVVHRVVEQKESLRTVAAKYGVSHETISRIVFHVQKQHGLQEE